MRHVFSCRVGAAPCQCATKWVNLLKEEPMLPKHITSLAKRIVEREDQGQSIGGDGVLLARQVLEAATDYARLNPIKSAAYPGAAETPQEDKPTGAETKVGDAAGATG